LKVYDIPEMARTARGRSIANLMTFQDGEYYTAVLPVTSFEEKFVFFCTAKGTVKKTALGAFSRPRPSGIIAIGLDPDDTLIHVELTADQDQIVLGTRDGMAVRFKQEDVRAMGRAAGGVRGITLKRDDRVVDMAVIRPGMSLLTICENGFGKRTDIDEYRLTRRGGSGVINIKTTDRNGPVVALKTVQDTDELMIITQKGIMLRTRVEEMREIGRATQGVKVIRLDEGDKVVGVARVAREDDEDLASPASEPGATDQATGTSTDPSDNSGLASESDGEPVDPGPDA
jgi:DNA gyrase subunit A